MEKITINDIKIAVIVTGGEATRLHDSTRDIPKQMLKVGDKPILHHQVDLLKRYGIENIIFIGNRCFDVVKEYFGDGKDFNVKVSYYEDNPPLGTGGCLKQLESVIKEPFFLLYGDSMLDVDLINMQWYYRGRSPSLLLTLHPSDHMFDSNLVEIDLRGYVRKIHKKPHDKNKIYRNLSSTPLYIVTPEVFQYIKLNEKQDFAKDIIPRVLKTKINVVGYVTPEYIKDTGTPERLERVRKDYKRGKIQRLNHTNKRKAIFLDRDGVLNEFKPRFQFAEEYEMFPNTGEQIKRINDSEYLAIVITNKPGVAKGECNVNDVYEAQKKMDTLLGKDNAKIDGFYFCPHHPDKGYPDENKEYKIQCSCRKPQPGMIIQATEDFNIDLPNSFMIGDSDRDVICGKSAGVTTIGVKGGEGFKYYKPDYLFDNLESAISFILGSDYKSIINRIVTESKKHNPFVLSIGGNSRSGKTTLSKCIQKELNEEGISSEIISLDNWILPEKHRKGNESVYERFNLKEIELCLLSIFSDGEATIDKYYSPLEKDYVYKKRRFKKKDVIIMEGVVALSLKHLSNLNIYCDISDELHKKRFFDFYKYKGKNENEIKKLYKERLMDEYNLIKETKKYADIIV